MATLETNIQETRLTPTKPPAAIGRDASAIDRQTLNGRTGQPVVGQVLPYDQVIARHARTSFHFASRFLPEQHRRSAVTLYSFFRTLDDIVDDPPSMVSPRQIQIELESWRKWFAAPAYGHAPLEPLGGHLHVIMQRHEIPTEPFLEFLDGLEHDLYEVEIVDDDDLERYCYQVASTVGIAMAYILGATSGEAIRAAIQLGAAMQLTNILRDVGEDLAAGRVYLPTETLKRFGLSRSELERLAAGGCGVDDRFQSMMQSQVELARSWYQDGLAGIWQLPQDTRFPILAASRLYRRLLTNIEKNAFDTLHDSVSTSRVDKIREAFVSYTLTRLWRQDE